MGGNTTVDQNGRPARMDTARVIAELSRTIVSMPLLEGVELTINEEVPDKLRQCYESAKEKRRIPDTPR